MQYFVCVSPEVGIGHLFTAILHSAFYAHATGRTLVLDMRRCLYFPKNRHEAFFENFGWRFPESLEVITDLRDVDRIVSTPGARMIVQGDRLDFDRPLEGDVLVSEAYAPGEPYTVDRRKADAPFQLTLKGALAERWDQAKKQAGWTGGAIGMHFRSMSGEFVERMNRFVIPDFDARVARIRDSYISTAQSLAETEQIINPKFFVASDDSSFIDDVRDRLNHVVATKPEIPTRPNQFWGDYLAENNFDISILADAVNDLWFLSECDAIIRSPHSGYSKFAILNSEKLTSSRIVDVPAPTCAEIFASLEPRVAVNWTRLALREAQARRVKEDYPYHWHADALERAGHIQEADHIRRLANWQWEAVHSPAANVPGEHWDPGELTGNKLDAAIETARSVAERLPNNPYVLAGYPPRGLAHLLAEAGKLDEAVAVAERAIAMEPEDAYLRWALGALLMNGGRYDEAERALRRAVALAPDDGALFSEYAKCLVKLDRMAEAVRMLRVAVALRPEKLTWRLELSGIFADMGAFDQAKGALLDGLPADNIRKAEILHALSILLEKTGQKDDAIDAIREACELEPRVLQWKYRLGELLIANNNTDEAVDVFTQILAIVPESAHANHAISILYQRQGRLDEALAAARRATHIEPEAPHRHVRLAEVLIALNEFKGAQMALNKAIGLRDDSAEARFMLSNVLDQLGQLSGALISARRALQIAPSDPRWQNKVAELEARIGEARPAVKQALDQILA